MTLFERLAKTDRLLRAGDATEGDEIGTPPVFELRPIGRTTPPSTVL